MKRIIIVLLSILLFTGCTQSPEIEVPTDRTLTSASAPWQGLSIRLNGKTQEYSFRVSMVIMDENKIESEHTISSSAGFPANETSDKKIQAVGFGSYVDLDGRPVFYTQFIRENSSIGSQQAVESDNSELGTSLISESIQDITIGEQYILMTLMEEGAHILPDAKTIQDYLEIDSVVGGRKYFLVITFE